MKYAPIVALALVAAFVAGCGGGSNTVTEEEHSELERQLEAERLAKERAEEKARLAAVREAAERRRAEAAEGQLEGEQEARQEAEERADELEEEAGRTADQLVQANARRYFEGLGDYLGDGAVRAGTADPTVTPRNRESALVTTTPSVTFSGITTGRSGNWDRTSFSHRGGTFFDQLDVYSDSESPEHVPFRDSVYNDGTSATEVPNTSALTIVDLYRGTGAVPSMVVDSEGDVVGSLDLSGDDVSNVVSSPFPRSGDPAESFSLVDRGFTPDEIAAGRMWYVAENDNDPDTSPGTPPAHCGTECTSSGVPVGYTGPRSGRNLDRYPLRYTYEQGGSLSGASGTYTCAYEMLDADSTCRVTNQNDHFRFVGDWVFTPGASARVRVDDAEFMYFGWWARQTNTDGSWDYRTFHGPTGTEEDGNRSTVDEMSQLSGSATYQGPAVGHYSFYQPLTAQSEYGEFNATATLTADFEEDEVHGFVDDFDVHSDWHLTLKHGDIRNRR